MSKRSDDRALQLRQKASGWIQRQRRRVNEKAGEALVKDLAGRGLAGFGPMVLHSLLSLGLPVEFAPVFALAWSILSVPTAASAGAIFGNLQSSEEPKARRLGAWGKAVVENAAESPSAFDEFIRQAQNPESRESLQRSLAAAMEVDDVEVIACLARLGCLYAERAKGPDAPFRETVNLVKSCSPDDLAVLRLLFAKLPGADVEGRVHLVPIRHVEAAKAFIPRTERAVTSTEQDGFNAVNVRIRGQRVSAGAHQTDTTTPVDDPHRVVALLTGHRHARAVTDGASMDLGEARRLASVIGPQAP